MGVTVLTGKKAEAMVANDGTVLYLLFESTYEKNCYPHTSHWGTVAFGTYEEVMARVTLALGDLEGGQLQSTKGWIKPENYVAAWRRELAAPAVLRQWSVTVNEDLFKHWTDNSADDRQRRLGRALAALDEAGLANWRTMLENCFTSPFELPITGHHDLIRVLAKHCTIWRMFESYPPSNTPFDNPPPLPAATGTAVFPTVKAYRCGPDDVLVSINNGPLSHWGWHFNAVGRYCDAYVVPAERVQPGISKKVIPAFREFLKSAPQLPVETVVKVWPSRFEDPANANVPWRREAAKDLAIALGLPPEVDLQESWEIPFDMLSRSQGLRYRLFHLDKGQIEFHVPVGAEETSTPNELQAA